MELVKEKRGHFLYRLFCPNEIFLTFVFYFNTCTECTFRIHILLHIKKHYFIHFCCFSLKSSKAFSVFLSNHRWDVSDSKTIPACHYLDYSNHNVNTYAKTTVMETIKNRNKPIEVIHDILRKRKNFYTKKLIH